MAISGWRLRTQNIHLRQCWYHALEAPASLMKPPVFHADFCHLLPPQYRLHTQIVPKSKWIEWYISRRLQPLSQTCSPKKFANQGLVYLSDIHCVEDLQELSAKQMKDMLAMNRVNFKGVVEKQELLKIVERVWRQHVKSTEGMKK